MTPAVGRHEPRQRGADPRALATGPQIVGDERVGCKIHGVDGAEHDAEPPDWRNTLIWRLGIMLGTVNATYFATNAFIPDYMRE